MHVTLSLPDGEQVVADTLLAQRETVVRRVRADGAQAWRLTLSDVADVVVLGCGGGRVYALVHPSGASGCRVAAVAEADGRLLWERRIDGPRPALHSKYSNRVELTVTGDAVVVDGRESAGTYRESLVAATGDTRSREVTAQ